MEAADRYQSIELDLPNPLVRSDRYSAPPLRSRTLALLDSLQLILLPRSSFQTFRHYSTSYFLFSCEMMDTLDLEASENLPN